MIMEERVVSCCLIVEMNVVHELLNVLQLPKTNSQRPLKMDGWKTVLCFREGLFSGAMLVLGSV